MGEDAKKRKRAEVPTEEEKKKRRKRAEDDWAEQPRNEEAHHADARETREQSRSLGGAQSERHDPVLNKGSDADVIRKLREELKESKENEERKERELNEERKERKESQQRVMVLRATLKYRTINDMVD